MKRVLCWLLVLGALPLCGCAGRVELALMAVCLGVDADAAGITLTVKSPDYAGSGASEEQDGYMTLSAAGSDWTQAVAALQNQAPMSLQFGQLREVVISQNALENMPPYELLGRIDQLPGVRSHALVTVCPGTAKEFVENQKPVIGKRLSKYLDISMQYWERQGCIPATSLACALRDLSGSWRCPMLAWVSGEGQMGGYILGEEQNLYLSGREVQLCRLIQGETQHLLLHRAGRYYSVSPRRRARLTLETREGRDTLVLFLPVTAAYSVFENPPGPGLEETLRQEAEALIGKLQATGCDALGFGCAGVRQYATLLQWQQGDWPARYREADVRVEVDLRFRQQPIV